MRALVLCLSLLPFSAAADVIALSAPITEVTVYAEGAVVSRQSAVELSEGTHTLRITGLDPALSFTGFDVDLVGATITSRTWRDADERPYRAPRTPDWLAAKAALDQAEEALRAHQDLITRTLAQAQAAQDQIDFLNDISLPEATATDVDTLRAIGQLIASDGTAARAAIADAQAQARALERLTPDLAFAHDQARAALREVEPRRETPAVLDLAITVAQAGQGNLTLRYSVQDANWAPFYTVRLNNDDTLSIKRSIGIAQYGAEDWTNAAATVSTLNLLERLEPGALWSRRLRIEDEEDVQKRGVQMRSNMADAEMVLEEPVIVEESVATADFSGVGVSYALAQPVTIKAGGDVLLVALDTLTLDADLAARAVPRLDETAYREVTIVNTTPEIMLPGEAQLFVGDQAIGTTNLALLPPDAETEIFFGPIQGLRLTRTVLDRNEGDRGIISRSNERRERIRLDMENLTKRAWDIELREAVPYSEQEDLVIDWTASPAPDIDGLDDRRGILAWNMQLEPGDTAQVTVDTEITWPEDKVLR